MNIAEARKVLWLKNNPKRLGDLLDEGYLDPFRLEWAAQKAFRTDLKEAAKLILDHLKDSPAQTSIAQQPPAPAYEVGITLEQARATLWPMPPFKGQPMGSLVDSRQLSIKDLGFAVENAWDEKVRRAATALLLARLDQIIKEPAPSAGHAKQISGGKSYSQIQQTRWAMIQGFIFGIILTALIALTYLTAKPRTASATTIQQFTSTPSGIITLLIALGIIVTGTWLFIFLTNLLAKRLDEKIENYRIGQEGEDKAAQLILQTLDGSWHLIRNLTIPGTKSDLDLILVGPPGIWVLEVKNFRGEYRNIGNTWERRHGKTWQPAHVNPGAQALKNAARLGNFLKADHINVFVNPVVIWANQESPLAIENPAIPIWTLNHLPDELGNIWHGEKLSEAERNKIIDKFSKLCEHQKQPA